jgi:hypothetical protein
MRRPVNVSDQQIRTPFGEGRRVAAAAVSDLFLVSAAFINNSATAIGRRKQLNGRHLQMRLLPGGTLLSFAGIVAATFHICLLI